MNSAEQVKNIDVVSEAKSILGINIDAIAKLRGSLDEALSRPFY